MNAQKFDARSTKELVTGTSGTGKTTLWEEIIRRRKARWKFIFDHQGEFSRRFGVQPCFDLDALAAAVEAGGWVCFDPVRMANELTADGERRGVQRCFDFFCDFSLKISETLRGQKLFGCDELQKLTSPKTEPHALLAILDTGRRFQLDFYAISQAPNRIHNAIRNQLTKVYTFRQSDANAVAYLAENGFEAEKIRSLPRGKYLWRDLDSGESGEGGSAF